MERDNRLHYLLKIIREPQLKAGELHTQYSWTFEQLRNAVNRVTPIKISLGIWRRMELSEVSFLCKELAKDGIGHIQSDGISIGANGMLEISQGAFYAKKYKERNGWFLAVSLSAIINVILAVAVFLVPFLQPTDNDLNKLQLELLKEKDEQLHNSNEELRSLKNTLKLKDQEIDSIKNSSKAKTSPQKLR